MNPYLTIPYPTSPHPTLPYRVNMIPYHTSPHPTQPYQTEPDHTTSHLVNMKNKKNKNK